MNVVLVLQVYSGVLDRREIKRYENVQRHPTFRSFDPLSPAGPSAPPAWRRCPVGWSPAAVTASLSAGENMTNQ